MAALLAARMRLQAALAVLVMLVASCYSLPSQAQTAATYGQAMAQCQASVAQAGSGFECSDIGYVAANAQCDVVANRTGDKSYTVGTWPYDCSTNTPPPTCKSGQNVPSGSSVDFYPAVNPVGPHDGETCSAGCEVGLVVGFGGAASMSGTYSLTGAVCSPSGTAKNTAPVTKPSEVTNPDGSKTWCDPISGRCVTSKSGDNSPPAPATSSGNNSTNSTSNTTTTPTDGSGSDDSGSGDTGGNTGTGSGSTGSGSGTGPASSSSTATKCTTGVCDVGEADGVVGDLYTASGDTPAGVFSQFKSDVSNAPIMAAATNFFTVDAAGACPTWHIPGNKYWGAAGFDFNFFCQPAILAILTWAGYVVLAVGAFCAFRIAIY